MKLIIMILCVFFAHFNLIYGQVDEDLVRQQVLEYNIVDSVFIFGNWTETKEDEAHIKFLGQVDVANGECYKVMTSMLIWGFSQRATYRILLYNCKNQYLGNYYVYNLPVKLVNGFLLFKNEEGNGSFINTKIDLNQGIPKQIFIHSKNDSGDLHNFDAE